MTTDSGIPSAVIRFSTLTPIIASLACARPLGGAFQASTAVSSNQNVMSPCLRRGFS
jgi:hypothetical protein